MIRSSSWSLALLPRREVSIADGFNEAFCPEIFIIQFKKIRHFFKKIIQIQIHIYEGISSINKHNYPTATFGFHFRAKILTVKKKKKTLISLLGHTRGGEGGVDIFKFGRKVGLVPLRAFCLSRYVKLPIMFRHVIMNFWALFYSPI